MKIDFCSLFTLALVISLTSCGDGEKSATAEQAEEQAPPMKEKITDEDSLRAAAEHGDLEAMATLAEQLYNGTDQVSQDIPAAVELFTKASEKGHAGAFYALGVCADRGVGMEKDNAKALDYFRRAATGGNARAAFFVARALELGYGGCEKNAREALQYYIKAANAGHPDACYKLGRLMLRRNGALKYDPDKAFQLFSKAAAAGQVDALCYLGVCHDAGLGTPQDAAKAVEAWKLAAKDGSSTATCYLGRCVAKGHGTEKNDELAAKLFAISAQRRNASGTYEYARCLLEGRGIAKDVAKAIPLLIAAAEAGVVPAEVLLGRCYASGNGVESNQDKAMEWWRKAAAAGSSEASALITPVTSQEAPAAESPSDVASEEDTAEEVELSTDTAVPEAAQEDASGTAEPVKSVATKRPRKAATAKKPAAKSKNK